MVFPRHLAADKQTDVAFNRIELHDEVELALDRSSFETGGEWLSFRLSNIIQDQKVEI